jgi:5-methylcytosine-specific restriction endonuclease McrA
MLCSGKAEVLSESDKVVHTVSAEYLVPLVLKRITSKYFNRRRKSTAINRTNIYLRDQRRCNYCDKELTDKQATLDHIHPACKGGTNSWENLTLACVSCNTKKADKTLEQCGMKLLRKPEAPTWSVITALKMTKQETELFKEWIDFTVSTKI